MSDEEQINNEPVSVEKPKKLTPSQAEALRIGREKRLENQKKRKAETDELAEKKRVAKEWEDRIAALEKQYAERQLASLKTKEKKLKKALPPTPESEEDSEEDEEEDEEEEDESEEEPPAKKPRQKVAEKPAPKPRGPAGPAYRRVQFV